MAKLQFFYLLMVFPSFILFANCQQGNNILWADQILTENQTLVSLNKQFELGFFNLDSDFNNQYMGIWYTSPNKTIVWVANGDRPITGGNGSLYLTSDGVLSLRNGSEYEIWSTSGRSKGTPVAILLDAGIFIVNDTLTGDISWQSNYELSNTLLPGMYLGYIMLPNLNQKMQLTSWKSDTDPSTGSYVYMLDPSRLYELVIVSGSTVTFRTGPWNGSYWNGMPKSGEAGLVAFQLKQSAAGAYFYYSSPNPAYKFRLIMSPSGTLYFWHSNLTSDWEVFEQIPPANSGQYAFCGPNAVSDGTNCTCLDAFGLKSGNFSDGCVRSEPLNCAASGFVTKSNVKLPDTINAIASNSIGNLDYCKQWCLANCSCTAFAILGSQGCVGWFGDLIDTVKLANNQGDNLYLRVAVPPPPPPPPHAPESAKKKVTRIISYVAMPAAIVATLAFGLLFIQCSRWNRQKIIKYQPPNTNMNIRNDELMIFEFNALRSATNNFNPENKLGEGQFGLVYKGILDDGEEIAVKRLARNSREGIENSKKEVTLLAKLRHPNLVKLLGFCVREEEMLLCYEYIPNRSLDQLLFGNLENQDSPLNWGMRYSILEGISAGLLYLHEDSGHAIIHREIKPSNILLDHNMVPKISDFGLSQLFDQDNLFVKLCRVASCGHMAPELQKKIISTNADVYSFGVIILEIVTGRKNNSFPSGLVAHVLQYWSEGEVQELIDPKLKKPYPVNEIGRCIHIALACLMEEPRMRPKIRQVNNMLINKQAPLPKLPHNCSYWELVVSDSSRNFEDVSLV